MYTKFLQNPTKVVPSVLGILTFKIPISCKDKNVCDRKFNIKFDRRNIFHISFSLKFSLCVRLKSYRVKVPIYRVVRFPHIRSDGYITVYLYTYIYLRTNIKKYICRNPFLYVYVIFILHFSRHHIYKNEWCGIYACFYIIL